MQPNLIIIIKVGRFVKKALCQNGNTLSIAQVTVQVLSNLAAFHAGVEALTGICRDFPQGFAPFLPPKGSTPEGG